MAIPVAATTFQCLTSARSEFCVVASGLRDRSSRDVAHSDRACDVGTESTHRITELDSSSDMGRSDRDVPVDGLRLLVVALGHAHASVFLEIS